MTLLSITGLTAAYGPVPALHGVDLDLGQGQALALMGRNGMGKTTTIRAVCGLMPGAGGTILFDGVALLGQPAHRIARTGIGLVPEGRRLFARLSVRENLVATARPGPWTLDRVTSLFPRLGERLGQAAPTLSGGEQQMLAIGRALMTNPRLLILDEATEGLAPLIRDEIWQALSGLKAEGLTLLIVDKSVRELAAVADAAVLLDRGRSVWAGAFAALTPVLTDRYLGV
jgi:branched-chain amino acid transport system ATP-binding protein